MGHAVSYSGLPENEARAKALADIASYLGGQEEFEGIKAVLMEGEFDRKAAILGLSILGITGFPAVVLVDQIELEKK